MQRSLKQQLVIWKDRFNRLPLLLRGARQVGKSYLVESFGKEHFDQVVIADFERRPELNECFKTREPKEILKHLEIALRVRIVPQKALLFFDEIQFCPEALVSLRYFKELMPELHVIAAGSLMEFLLNDDRYSFPVGRVEFLYLRPFSFIEYLQETSPSLIDHLEAMNLQYPPSPAIHEAYIKEVRKYLFTGGMPAPLLALKQSDSLLECQRVQKQILQAYENDFGKYARQTQHKYLQLLFKKAPSFIGQVIKYSRIDSGVRSRELKQAFELLGQAGLIQQIFATTASGLPLLAHTREHRFKILFLDIGLLQTATEVDAEAFWQEDVLQINAGMLAEQFVGQELLAYSDPSQNHPLLFWENEGGGEAEIDYVVSLGSQVYPIEVKAGSTEKLRSLQLFLKTKKTSLGVRISEQPLCFQHQILSVPLYLVSALPRLIKQALKHLIHSA